MIIIKVLQSIYQWYLLILYVKEKNQHLWTTYTLRTASKVAGLLKRNKKYSLQPAANFAHCPKYSPTTLLEIPKKKPLYYEVYLEQTGLLIQELRNVFGYEIMIHLLTVQKNVGYLDKSKTMIAAILKK